MTNDNPFMNNAPVNTPPNQPIPQPGMPAPGQPMPAAPQAVYQENPGQLLGIIGLVMLLLTMPYVSIVLGIISRNQSKKAGASTTLGTLSLVLGTVFTVLGALLFILFIALAVMAPDTPKSSSADSTTRNPSSYTKPSPSTPSSSGVVTPTPTPSNSSSPLEKRAAEARIVASKAEAYRAKTGDFPKKATDFSAYSESTLDPGIHVYSSLMLTNTSLTYIYCGAGAAQIAYLGETKEDKRITALGSASTTTVCERQF